MTPHLWVPFWSLLPTLALLSGQDVCSLRESSSSQNASSLLESLQCHNDYESYVHCEWRKHRLPPPQLWFKTGSDRNLCVPYSSPGQPERGTVQCRYKTRIFSIGIKHTVFFTENQTQTVCSSPPHKPLDLSQHLRARSPGDLSSHDEGDGGRRLSWSGPYASTSSLNQNITYQLSYWSDHQDHWTTEGVANTSVKVERQYLLPGRRYEARVRARASVGQWSHWSPVVTWETKENKGQFPTLYCVLEGEREVMCSWEVSRELANFVTYQLTCRHGRAASAETCCTNPTLGSDHGSHTLRYSCSLTVADPARLPLLELQPTRTAKTFRAYQHIRPNPPQQLKVKEKQSEWVIEWSKQSSASKLKLFYQVCYYRIQEQGCSTLLNISAGSTSLTLQGVSLSPSQRYRVKVRSLVEPGDGSRYQGIPSEWTDPVDWTSHAATWSLSTLIYVLICVSVVTVFFTLYCTIPACHRRVILWVDSIPSPSKSQILTEIKSTTLWTSQSEDTSICKVDDIPTCSLNSLLWPNLKNKNCMELEEAFCNSDEMPTPAKKANGCDTSSISFSGPYIFCQNVESSCCEEKEDETFKSDKPPLPLNFDLKKDGYVCLPNPTVSRSTQDLVSTTTQSPSSAEPPRECSDLREASGRDRPPAYATAALTPWPQGGTVHTSGYCHLPWTK